MLIEMVGGPPRTRRLLLRADTGRGPLVDITDPGHPRAVGTDSLGLPEPTVTRLREWSTAAAAERDLRWQMTGAGVASDLEDELPDTAVHYARGEDDPRAPEPERPPGGGRTFVFSDPSSRSSAYSSSLHLTFGAPPVEPPRVLATDQDDTELAELRRRVVEPVAHSLLDDAEYRSTRVYRQSDEPDAVRVDVEAAQESYVGGWLIWPSLVGIDRTVEDLTEQFASNLEDWVCESRFAWGEQRRAVYVIPPASPPA